jgi:periplasmic protein TonB
MLKKSFFLSFGIHALLGAAITALILLMDEPRQTIYIPLTLNSLQNPVQEKKILKTPTCPKHITHHKHLIKKQKPIPKPKKIVKKKIIKKKIVKKTIPVKKVKKIIQEKKLVAKIPTDVNTTTPVTTQHQIVHQTIHQPAHLIQKTRLTQANSTQVSPQTRQKIKNRYLDELYQIINENKVYPIIARKLNQTGIVKVSFTILKNGEIQNIEIKESSGFTLLDNAAQNILKKISKIKPIPSELDQDKLKIILPIVYQLN